MKIEGNLGRIIYVSIKAIIKVIIDDDCNRIDLFFDNLEKFSILRSTRDQVTDYPDLEDDNFFVFVSPEEFENIKKQLEE